MIQILCFDIVFISSNSGTWRDHFHTTRDILRPRPLNKKTPNDLRHYRLHELPTLKSIFGLNHVLKMQWIDITSFWKLSCHVFHRIKTLRCGMVRVQKAAEKRKAAQSLLNSCSELRVCATLWVIYRWKHSHGTEYWCQLHLGGDEDYLLCWVGRHVDNTFFIL